MSNSNNGTPPKPIKKYTINSLPSSPFDKKPEAKNRSPVRPHPNAANVENFISTVNIIKKAEAVRNLSREFKDIPRTAPKIDEDKVKAEVERTLSREKTWKCGEDSTTVPDYGVRSTMYKQNFDASLLDSISESSSSDLTGETAFDRFEEKSATEALNILNRYRRTLDPDVSDDKVNLQMLSLSKLWKKHENVDPSKYKEKLQEEKLRRQHCEDLIQQLQNKCLEYQEKLAVAVKVDEAKDRAIHGFEESWNQFEKTISKLEEEKSQVERELTDMRNKYQREIEIAQKEATRLEKEATDAKTYVWECKEKIASLEKRLTEMDNELKMSEANVEEMKVKYGKEIEKNKNYPEIIAQKEVELNECRTILYEARKEVQQSKKAVEICQAELNVIKEENTQLGQMLRKEKETVAELQECKRKLLYENENRKKIQKSLQDELKEVREQVEQNKIELKNFYQGQVELVVSTKLKEFQGQLDNAEEALREEMKKRELSIAKKAAIHIQQINEKNEVEIKLLEQRHAEEINFYQMKLNKLLQELDEVRQKLSREREKSHNFHKQVMKFVESLKQDENSASNEKFNTYNNLEEIMSSMNEDEDANNKKLKENKEKKDVQQPSETPRNQRKQAKDNDLRNLIDVLLDRPPGQPTNDSKDEKHMWQPPLANEGSSSFRKDKKNNEKRPWK